jgi:hypothetical protein
MIRSTEGSWFDSRQTENIFLFSKTFGLSVGPTLCPIDCVTEVRRATDDSNHSTAYGVEKSGGTTLQLPAHIWIYGVYMDSFIVTFTVVFKDANEVTDPS